MSDVSVFLDSYPLAQKALDEQGRIFSKIPDGIPTELKTATLRAAHLLHEHLAPSDFDKQTLITVAILMNCPPYISLKSKRFTDDYSPAVQALMDAHTGQTDTAAYQGDLAQIYSAMFIAHGENMLKRLSSTPNLDKHWLRDIQESLEEYVEDRKAHQDKIAPGLMALETDLVQRTIAFINLHTRAPTKSNKPPSL